MIKYTAMYNTSIMKDKNTYQLGNTITLASTKTTHITLTKS